MRNLKKYPITFDEVIETVHDAVMRELNSEAIGGIQAAALGLAEEYLLENSEWFDRWLKEKQSD